MDNIDEKNNFVDGRMTLDNIKSAFESIWMEFDDHLEAINDNTVEIKENYDKVMRLELKIEKLAERIDMMHMILSDQMSKKEKYKNILLNDIEQKVFLALYLEKLSISFTMLSRKIGLKRPAVKLAIDSLKRKGIPFYISRHKGDFCVILEPAFRDLQAKENVIKIDEKNQKNLFVRDLRFFF